MITVNQLEYDEEHALLQTLSFQAAAGFTVNFFPADVRMLSSILSLHEVLHCLPRRSRHGELCFSAHYQFCEQMPLQ